MNKVAIIADDFTSANDCGLPFKSSGFDTTTLLECPSQDMSLDYEVVAIDVDSRNQSEEEAYERTRSAIELVCKNNYKLIFKTIDSTLRGNLCSEIEAIRDSTESDFIFIAPAFPYYGRKIISGIHYLDNILLENSYISNDPLWPLNESNLVEILSQKISSKVGLVRLQDLRSGRKEVLHILKNFQKENIDVVVFDSESEKDLVDISYLSLECPYKNILVGSTGIARQLPQAFKNTNKPAIKSGDKEDYLPVIIVSGSVSTVTLNQIEELLADKKICPICINPLEFLDLKWSSIKMSLLEKVEIGVQNQKDILIYLESKGELVKEMKLEGEKLGYNEKDVTELIVSHLSTFVQELISFFKIRGLVLTGGHTAKEICKAIGGVGLKLLNEVEPGIPIGNLQGESELLVVTKAGAFGSKKVFNKSIEIIKELRKYEK